jgi:hypothetical protein
MTEEEAFQQAMRELEAERAANPSATVPPQEEAPKATPHRTTPEQVMDLIEDMRVPSEQPEAAPHRSTPEEIMANIEDTTVPPKAPKSLLQRGVDLWKSAGAGIAKAGFETKDFLFGETPEDQKSAIRRGIEGRAKELASESTANAMTMGISQMVTGLIGAGKIMAPIKAAKWMAEGGKVAKAGYEIGKASAASAVVLDPHEERLSNLIEEFPALSNPVTAYLAAKPEDTAAEGRFKNALESIGADLALVGAVKALKYLRSGDMAAAKKTITKLADPKPGLGATSESDASGQTRGPQIMEITDDVVAAMLESTRSDQAAIKEFGSFEAAAEAGEITRRSATSLPWQKLRSTDEVASFMDHAARVLKTQMDDIKGGAVLSDAKVNSMVEARAELFGEDPAIVMGQIKEAGAAAKDMVANMEASYLIGSRMMEDVFAKSFRMVNGMETDMATAGEELKARLMASADFLASAQSISSNSGRALRRMRGQFRFPPELLEKVKTMDGAELARLLYQTKGNPKLIAQTINPNFLARWTGGATDSLTNSLLWLYPTHVMNMTGNLFMLAARPAEKWIGSLAMNGPEASAIRQQAQKEYRYTLASLSDGWDALVEAFQRGDSILSPHNTEYFRAQSQGDLRQFRPQWSSSDSPWSLVRNGLTAAGIAMRLPTRTLGAMDEFIKTLRYRAYVQADAATKGQAMGLTGADLQKFIQGKMEEAIDPLTGQALDRKALYDAQVTTFQQELLPGTVGATLQMVRSRHPALTFILPFIKTPINVLRYSIKMTPGLNLLQREYREAISGNMGREVQAHAMGQMALGSTFMGLAASLALSGKMTGGGPNDPELQRQLRSTGWLPYSYVLGDGEGRRFIPMGRVDPVGMSMSMVADLVEALQHDPDGGETENGILALTLALAKKLSDRTFLLNMHQTLQALTDPGQRGERWLGNLAGNTIPFSSAMRGINPDPYLRDARGFIDTALKNLPGYSQTLPPVRDAFGEPIWKSISITSTDRADIVEAENNRIILETGSGIHKPSPRWEGLDLRDITLKSGRTAYDRFQELSGHVPGQKPLKYHLEKLIKSKTYRDMPDGDPGVTGTRLNALNKIITKYREAARYALIRENPELKQFIKARQKAARGAILENRKADSQVTPSARALLDAMRPQ